MVFTWSGSHHHSVVLVAYRGGVAPTALTAGVTNRLVDVSLPNAQLGHAGAVLVCDGFCSNYTSVPVWTNGMTARFTRDVAIAGYVVADQSFTDSDAWTGSKTFTPGNGGSAALILASSVLIKTP